MPSKAPTNCTRPGCRGVVRDGRCSICGPLRKSRGNDWDSSHKRRGATSPQARGYGENWRKLRAIVLTAEPFCRECQQGGIVRVASQVDHIVPKAEGGTDNFDNLQPLCREHHAKKTAMEGQRARYRPR